MSNLHKDQPMIPSRWIQSRELDRVTGNPSGDVVYRDPYCSLRKTVTLFTKYPALASSVARIFFDGFYDTETSAMIFEILQHCNRLDTVSLPWTTLRYGSADRWATLLRQRDDGTALSSLELLAVDLKHCRITEAARQMDKQPLTTVKVNLSSLKRLKLSGSSNLMPICDEDLIAMSRTAQLHEIHVTGTTAITTKGLVTVCQASRDTLRLVEHSPLSDDGFEHPDPLSTSDGSHMCEAFTNCPHLSSLAVSLPTICCSLFSDESTKWAGDVQIRAAGICGVGSLKQSTRAQRAFFELLSRARSLVEFQREKGIDLSIEIFIGMLLRIVPLNSANGLPDHLIFEPSKELVHADLSVGHLLSAGSWPLSESASSKGPYGQTGQYGKDEQPYSCISQQEFAEGLQKGYISF